MSQIKLFQSKQIRSFWDEKTEKWYFAVVDVVEVLTESTNPRRYWSDLKRKLTEEGASQLYEKIVQLKMLSSDGKRYKTDCADAETMLRIIQSIPSPNAEPFKLWLAQVGYERLEEIENPELAAERARELYRAKGYPEEWIDTRLQSITVRNELTNEWKARKVKEGQEYAILTAEISKATFGVTPGEHKVVKKLEKENLRDHMTTLELVFTMLGEASTAEIARRDDAQGFEENREAAQEGGQVAGIARRELESRTGKPVLSSQNYLWPPQQSLPLPPGNKKIDE